MKKLILITALLTTTNLAFSQTQNQLSLVERYITGSGGNILQDAAHPMCTWSTASVRSAGNHTYDITMNYTQVLTSNEFACHYRLRLSSTGKFLSLQTTGTCASVNSNCFGTCRVIWNGNDLPDQDIRQDLEDYVGKAMENMTCEEYTNAKMFLDWKAKGYYSRY